MTKYKAKKITIGDLTFASLKEGRRYQELLLLLRGGEIFDLAIQPEFEFKLNGKRMFRYIADFSYTNKDGSSVTEDVKGVRTPVYRIKRKIIEEAYGIKITEI